MDPWDLADRQRRSVARDLLLRTGIGKKTLRAVRRLKYMALARRNEPPFNGDQIMTRTIDTLIEECGVETFVETGTYLGHSCRYVASRHPNLRVATIEIDSVFFELSRSVLAQYANVETLFGDSPKVLTSLLQGGMYGLPLFFLDAHWYKYLPLPDEIRTIAAFVKDAIIVIHDFQVPAMDYGFDICQGQAICRDLLLASIGEDNEYQIYYPNYTYSDAYKLLPRQVERLRGYAIVFQGARGAAVRFGGSESFRWYGADIR